MHRNCKFGPFLVDLTSRQLSRDGLAIPLTPKVFQTLEILLCNRDRIVSKQELLDAIWPEAHVEEANLTQNIFVLRRALGETNSGIKFIATFPKCGYRFIGTVEEESGSADGAPAAAAQVAVAASRGELRYGWAAGCILLPAALLAVSRLLPMEPPKPPLGAQRTITHLPGRAFQPAISPDGDRVAFVSRRDLTGPLRIYVSELGTSSAPQALNSGDGDAFSPAWSPDGQRLAYLHAAEGSLRLVLQTPGERAETVTEILPESSGVVARQLDWSPDGRFLAVSAKGAAGEPFRIELVHIAEGRMTVLTTPPELSDGDFQPRFSPDGSKLAFVRQRSIGSMEVLFVPIPGGDPSSVSEGRDPCGDVDWTPDSRSLLYTPEPVTTSQLCEVPVVGGGKPGRCQMQGELGTGMFQFAVSRRTGHLVLARAQPQQELWRARLDAQHTATDWERLVSTGENAYPVYSPDNRRIAYVSDRSGDQQIWIRENDGRERQITFGDLKPGAPSWTAKGDSLFFPALRRRVLYRVDAAGGGLKQVSVGAVGAHTVVSPDGAWVYLVQRFYVMRAPASGGTPTRVTDQGGFPLRQSPEGKWIYYVRNRFSSEIWRMRLADGFAERVTDRLIPGCWGCWSVNAAALVYLSDATRGAVQLERLDLASGQLRDLGPLPSRLLPPLVGMLSLSPDDRSVVAVLAEPGRGDIHLMVETPWSRPLTAAVRR